MTTATQNTFAATTLPINELRVDEKANVRRIGRGAERDMIASIKALGIQQPLIVRKNGKGYVVADGGKRLEAAQALVKSGDLAADAPIPVIIGDFTDARAREISLALNVVRSDMHPVDAFRAFDALHTNKEEPLNVEEIANRFGLSVKIVEQRLALGALHDDILNAWRDGLLNDDTAKAFTLCSGKKAQAALYAKLSNKGKRRVGTYEVRQALKIAHDNVGKYLNAIGIENYEKRGGKVTRDLFGSDHQVSDAALVETMAQELLAETCRKLVEEQGWAWATSDEPQNSYTYGRLQGQFTPTPEEKKLLEKYEADSEDNDLSYEENEKASEAYDDLKEKIELRTYTPKQRAKAGCFVGFGNDGTIRITYGRIKPLEVERREEVAGTADGKKVAKAKGPAKLSNALLDRLTRQRANALRNALTAHPHKEEIAKLLAKRVASTVNFNSRHGWTKEHDAYADAIDAKVMNAALRKAFDAKDYFENAPKSFTLAAVACAVSADEARKLGSKKRPEIAKFAIANVPAKNWLPKEMRTANYDGPVEKPVAKKAPAKKTAAKKKAAKPAAKSKSKNKRK